MYTVSSQDFLGYWTSETFSTKDEAFGYIAGLGIVNALEIDGVEQEDRVISFDELWAWLNA